MSGEISVRSKLAALYQVAAYRPALTVGIVGLSLVVAALEGIGLGFILPIIEVARGTQDPSGPVRAFVGVYDALGVPFTLGSIVVGVMLVIGTRYLVSFLVGWLSAMLRMHYIRTLRTQAFENALDARISLDEATSDPDSHLEEHVHSCIETMERDYAMIAIAHRLSTVTNADSIHMMEDGGLWT